MGFECGFEIAKKDGSIKPYNLYYLGNPGDFVDRELINAGEKLDEDGYSYKLDKNKLYCLLTKFTAIYTILRKYSPRVISEFNDYTYTGENFPAELKKEYGSLKDSLYGLDAEESDADSIFALVPILQFLLGSEIFNDYNNSGWLNATDYELRYWRSW